jgi:hypothetical protein
MIRGLAILFAIAILAVALAVAATDDAAPQDAAPPSITLVPATTKLPCSVGVGGCSASSCHGAAIESSKPWQSAFTVWSTQDPHAQAYSVLFGPLAKQIVANLNGPSKAEKPAHQNLRCIGCHTTENPGQPTNREFLAEGVGCEACHGAAENWVAVHTRKDWLPSHGMVDTKSPVARTQRCMKCHVGDDPRKDGATRDVNHDLIAAGHPRLAFEATSYLEALPRHWEKNAAEDPIIAWAAGRVATLDAAMNISDYRSGQLSAEKPKPTDRPPWPEFAEFDCYSCHRPMNKAENDNPLAHSFGKPRSSTWYSALTDVSRQALGSEKPIQIESFAGLDAKLPASRVDTRRDLRQLLKQAASLPTNAKSAASTAELATKICEQTDAANWDQAAQAYAALKALSARSTTGDQARLDAKLTDLRAALVFPLILNPRTGEPIQIDFGRPAHFDGPRNYSPEKVRRLIQEIVQILAPNADCSP